MLCSLLLCWSCRFLASLRVVSLRARLDDCWRCLRCSRTLLRSFSLSSSICCRQRSVIVGIGAPPSWVVHSRWPRKPVANLSRSRRTRLLRWSTRQLCTIPSVVQWYLVGRRDRRSLQLRANGSRPHRTVQASLTSIAQLDLTATDPDLVWHGYVLPQPHAGLRSAYGGTSTNVPINRNRACCSGPAPSLRKAPTSMCDKRPPEGALGWWITNA
jgi:hypothetical protein